MLDGLKRQYSPTDCFERVLTEWNSRRCSPYTWDTIITVLQASAVGEVALANTLAAKYGKHIFLCASVECRLDMHRWPVCILYLFKRVRVRVRVRELY